MSKQLVRREILKVLTDLPEFCFSRLNTTGEPIIIKRGSTGYYPTHGDRDVERLNVTMVKATAAQVLAMEIGSMAGFDVPGADPLNHPDLTDASWYPADLRRKWRATRIAA